jgi:hypothetical protein
LNGLFACPSPQSQAKDIDTDVLMLEKSKKTFLKVLEENLNIRTKFL